MDPNEGQGSETGTPVVETPVAETGTVDQGGGLNPAWNELLEVVPSQLHSLVTPHLTKWDQNFQTKINEVHSKYAPYKDFADNGVEAEQIQYAMQMLEAIDQRPVDVIKALTDYAKQAGLWQEETPQNQGQQQQQGQVDETEIPSDFMQHPEFQKMQQMVTTMAQQLVQQNEIKTQQEEDRKLRSELDTLKEQHGEFDEDWVLTKAIQMANAGKNVTSLEPFVKQYREFEQGILAKSRQPGPKVMSPAGMAPDNQVNLKELDDKGRRGLVTQMLQAAAQQSQ